MNIIFVGKCTHMIDLYCLRHTFQVVFCFVFLIYFLLRQSVVKRSSSGQSSSQYLERKTAFKVNSFGTVKDWCSFLTLQKMCLEFEKMVRLKNGLCRTIIYQVQLWKGKAGSLPGTKYTVTQSR